MRASVVKDGCDIRGEQQVPVFVLPPAAPPPPPPASYNQENIACCCSSVSAWLRVTLDKGAVGPNETLGVTIEAHNGTNGPFPEIDLELKRPVVVATAYQATHGRAETDAVLETAVPGLAPGECAEGATARRLQITVPIDVLPTMASALVRCDYVVDVLLKGKIGRPGVRVAAPVFVTGLQLEGSRREGTALAHPEGRAVQVFYAEGVMHPAPTVPPPVQFQFPTTVFVNGVAQPAQGSGSTAPNVDAAVAMAMAALNDTYPQQNATTSPYVVVVRR